MAEVLVVQMFLGEHEPSAARKVFLLVPLPWVLLHALGFNYIDASTLVPGEKGIYESDGHYHLCLEILGDLWAPVVYDSKKLRMALSVTSSVHT